MGFVLLLVGLFIGGLAVGILALKRARGEARPLAPRVAHTTWIVGGTATVSSWLLLHGHLPWKEPYAQSDAPEYGFALFVVVPLAMGFLTSLLMARDGGPPPSRGRATAHAFLVQAVTSFGMILCRIEGVICLVMALPLTLVLTIAGVYAGRLVAPRLGRPRAWVLLIPLAAAPVAKVIEASLHPVAYSGIVRTHASVSRAPEPLWAALAAPTIALVNDRWPFSAGVSFPTRLTFTGPPSALRMRIDYSNGAIDLEARRDDSNRTLTFRFPAGEPLVAMKEMSPYLDLQPEHVRTAFSIGEGRIAIRAPEGSGGAGSAARSEIEATSTYVLRMWPTTYWHLWSDFILDAMHGEVLRSLVAGVGARKVS